MATATAQKFLSNVKKTWPLDVAPKTVTPVTTPKTVTPTKPVTPVVNQQAQKPVSSVPQTPQRSTTPAQPTMTPTTPVQTLTEQKNTQQYTQPATNNQTKVWVPLDQWITPKSNAQTGQLDYQTPDEARLQQIQQNLTQYSQTSPEMFKDRSTFEANFNYGSRSNEQKKVLDSFYKDFWLKQGNQDIVYQTLIGWGQIDPKYQTTEWFKQGYAKYQRIWALSSLDAKWLAGQIWSRIIVWSSEWQELTKINPQLAQDALVEKKKIDAERMVNGTAYSLDWIEEWRMKEVDVLTQSLVKQFENLQKLNVNLAEEYKKNVLEDPVIQGSYEKIRTLSEKRNTIESEMDRALEEAYASAWWAPDSVIRARANMTSWAMLRQLALVNSDIEVEQAFMDSQIKQKEGYYSSIVDEYNQELSLTQQSNKILGDISGVISGTLAEQRKAKEAEQQAQIQYERDMAMEQAKQEYQITRDDQAFQRQVALADRKYEQDLQQLQWWTVVWSQLVTQDPQSIVDYSLTKRWATDGKLQCWELTNDYVEKITWHTSWSPTWVWNTYQSKVNAINAIGTSKEPQVWWLFAFNTKSGTWHIGIVQSVNPDGSIQVLEANRSWNSEWDAPTLATYKNTSNMVFSKEPKPKLSKDDSKVAWDAISQIKSKQIVKDYEKLYSKEKMLDWIITKLKNWTQTSQDDQQLISDFAKVLDPDSVVRESEYELSSKYSMSRLNKMKQDAYNYLKTGWPLTKDAATVLAAGLRSRYDIYKQNAISEVDAVLAGTEYTLGYKLPAWALWLWWYNQSWSTTNNQQSTQSILANPNKWLNTKVSMSTQSLVDDLFK